MLALHELISFLTGLRYKGMEGEGRAGGRGGRLLGPRWSALRSDSLQACSPGNILHGEWGGLADLTCAGLPTGWPGWTRAAVHGRERMHVKKDSTSTL